MRPYPPEGPTVTDERASRRKWWALETTRAKREIWARQFLSDALEVTEGEGDVIWLR